MEKVGPAFWVGLFFPLIPCTDFSLYPAACKLKQASQAISRGFTGQGCGQGFGEGARMLCTGCGSGCLDSYPSFALCQPSAPYLRP